MVKRGGKSLVKEGGDGSSGGQSPCARGGEPGDYREKNEREAPLAKGHLEGRDGGSKGRGRRGRCLREGKGDAPLPKEED